LRSSRCGGILSQVDEGLKGGVSGLFGVDGSNHTSLTVLSRGLRTVEPNRLGVLYGDGESVPFGTSFGWLVTGEETTSSKWVAGISET